MWIASACLNQGRRSDGMSRSGHISGDTPLGVTMTTQILVTTAKSKMTLTLSGSQIKECMYDNECQ
jgi:hypothetical protein